MFKEIKRFLTIVLTSIISITMCSPIISDSSSVNAAEHTLSDIIWNADAGAYNGNVSINNATISMKTTETAGNHDRKHLNYYTIGYQIQLCQAGNSSPDMGTKSIYIARSDSPGSDAFCNEGEGIGDTKVFTTTFNINNMVTALLANNNITIEELAKRKIMISAIVTLDQSYGNGIGKYPDENHAAKMRTNGYVLEGGIQIIKKPDYQSLGGTYRPSHNIVYTRDGGRLNGFVVGSAQDAVNDFNSSLMGKFKQTIHGTLSTHVTPTSPRWARDIKPVNRATQKHMTYCMQAGNSPENSDFQWWNKAKIKGKETQGYIPTLEGVKVYAASSRWMMSEEMVQYKQTDDYAIFYKIYYTHHWITYDKKVQDTDSAYPVEENGEYTDEPDGHYDIENWGGYDYYVPYHYDPVDHYSTQKYNYVAGDEQPITRDATWWKPVDISIYALGALNVYNRVYAGHDEEASKNGDSSYVPFVGYTPIYTPQVSHLFYRQDSFDNTTKKWKYYTSWGSYQYDFSQNSMPESARFNPVGTGVPMAASSLPAAAEGVGNDPYWKNSTAHGARNVTGWAHVIADGSKGSEDNPVIIDFTTGQSDRPSGADVTSNPGIYDNAAKSLAKVFCYQNAQRGLSQYYVRNDMYKVTLTSANGNLGPYTFLDYQWALKTTAQPNTVDQANPCYNSGDMFGVDDTYLQTTKIPYDVANGYYGTSIETSYGLAWSLPYDYVSPSGRAKTESYTKKVDLSDNGTDRTTTNAVTHNTGVIYHNGATVFTAAN